jgi:hypothetical protein
MPGPGGPPVITSEITPATSYPVDAPISVQMPPPGQGTLFVTISKGQALTFTVTAAGDRPMSYVWSFKNDDINGAKAAQYTIQNIQSIHSGPYTVLVINRAGAAGSAAVFVTVKEP